MRRQRQRQRCAALAQPRAACLPRCRAAHPPAEPARAAQGLTAGASEPASPASQDLFKAMEEKKGTQKLSLVQQLLQDGNF